MKLMINQVSSSTNHPSLVPFPSSPGISVLMLLAAPLGGETLTLLKLRGTLLAKSISVGSPPPPSRDTGVPHSAYAGTRHMPRTTEPEPHSAYAGTRLALNLKPHSAYAGTRLGSVLPRIPSWLHRILLTSLQQSGTVAHLQLMRQLIGRSAAAGRTGS